MRSVAKAPGSVTLFFEIVDDLDIMKKGSRGVGVCVEPGAITEVSDDGDTILLNGKRVEGRIQRYIARKLGFHGTVKTDIHLPISQGFGMSAAIALSTALAIARNVNMNPETAAKVAHEAEIHFGTGLGDVASEYTGGFTVRERAGMPPHGRIWKIPYNGELTLVVFGEKIRTKDIITSEDWRKRIRKEGARAMEDFLKNPTVENAIIIGRRFSLSLGLMSGELRNFLTNCENATQALLGNAAIVFGKCPMIEDTGYHVNLGTAPTILE